MSYLFSIFFYYTKNLENKVNKDSDLDTNNRTGVNLTYEYKKLFGNFMFSTIQQQSVQYKTLTKNI